MTVRPAETSTWSIRRQLIDWRGHRFEIVEVTDLAPGYRQCLLRFVDAPDRLPLSVPASDLTDARPVTD